MQKREISLRRTLPEPAGAGQGMRVRGKSNKCRCGVVCMLLAVLIFAGCAAKSQPVFDALDFGMSGSQVERALPDGQWIDWTDLLEGNIAQYLSAADFLGTSGSAYFWFDNDKCNSIVYSPRISGSEVDAFQAKVEEYYGVGLTQAQENAFLEAEKGSLHITFYEGDGYVSLTLVDKENPPPFAAAE